MALISLTRHEWLIAIFLLCGVVVFSNGIHFLLFWIMRKERRRAERHSPVRPTVP